MSGYFTQGGKSFTRVHDPLVNRGTPANPDLEVRAATASLSGYLSAADKAKLDALYSTSPTSRVYHSANQSIANITVTALALNSERDDTHAFHDTATNNSRLTIPTGLGGRYLIGGTVEFAAAAGGLRIVAIRTGGTTDIARERWVPAGNDTDTMTVVTLALLNAGNYVELTVYQSSGGALNVQASSAFSPEFWLVRLGS
jgi:hypothetical protein